MTDFDDALARTRQTLERAKQIRARAQELEVQSRWLVGRSELLGKPNGAKRPRHLRLVRNDEDSA
jgi:hypothetical protein